jgi:hypothetical protein
LRESIDLYKHRESTRDGADALTLDCTDAP